MIFNASMENKNYTIKDIAHMAGVSVGTVDRVLHNRGAVSKTSLEKVRKVIESIDYRPNMFAIGLAAKKKYTFFCALPYYSEGDYWHTIAQGINRAARELQPFNISIQFAHYKHSDETSYKEVCEELSQTQADAVLLAPIVRGITRNLARTLDERNIFYAFIDHNIHDTQALVYIGQDSYMSGYIAGKILMNDFEEGQEVALFLNNNKDNPAEIQMQRRIEGFTHYISEEYKGVTTHEVVLNKEHTDENKGILDRFFQNHPNVQLGVVFNSRVHHIGDYLQASGRRLKSLVGYDLLQRNVELLKCNHVKYLIGQRPALQGYYGVMALCDKVVFKREISPIKYMPIDILMKENIDYYFEFE